MSSGGASCCGPAGPGQNRAPKEESRSTVLETESEWKFNAHVGEIKCRLSNSFRMNYSVTPGLYALGAPDKLSDVFVSANYKLSFDKLRRSLKGLNAWILVLDTKGINVWCAAGEGTFGTEELAKRVAVAGLQSVVDHRRLIVPQLGGPGVAGHVVKKRTGFNVYFGPVRSEDIPAYLGAKYEASKEMREVKFTILDRLVLTPMEVIPALRAYAIFAVSAFLIFGLTPSGVVFGKAWADLRPVLILGLAAVCAGAFLTPLFLNLVPSRSFAVKGWLAGIVVLAAASPYSGLFEAARSVQIFAFLFFPLASSYLALQFTGATVFTGISGVKKELRFALPVYVSGAAVSLLFLVAFKLGEFGLI